MNSKLSPVDLTADEISRRLEKAQPGWGEDAYPEFSFPSELLPDAPRPAAVLIPLLLQDNAWHVLFTRRQATLPEHSGQVAFPGGRAEPEDRGPEMTALREAQEEINLDPQDVRILGRLGEFLTITGYRVTPVVGVIPWPYPLQPAPVEVSRVFTIPLEWLADASHYEARPRDLPMPFSSRISVIYYQPYDGEILWGASAGFTLALLNVLQNGGPPATHSFHPDNLK